MYLMMLQALEVYQNGTFWYFSPRPTSFIATDINTISTPKSQMVSIASDFLPSSLSQARSSAVLHKEVKIILALTFLRDGCQIRDDASCVRGA